MSEDRTTAVVWYRQKVVLFICGSIVIALFLVSISLALYASSGTAQLDLSRPGFKSAQSQLDQSESFENFSADGPVNKQTIDNFERIYKKQKNVVDSTDVFSGAALDPQALGIDAPAADE